MENLYKRLAILALATLGLLGICTALSAAPGGGADTPEISHATTHRHYSSVRSTAHHHRAVRRRRRVGRVSHVRHVRHVRYARRSRRAWNPWRLSSYGDPSADDNPAGDDPIVRQAAIGALGKWNGSMVVVDPNNGRILSIVNQKLALSSGFTPCSTFKPVVALAALREGIVTPATRLYVGAHQRVNLTEALAHSNNAYFHKLGEMLGFRRITEYAEEFGLGQKAGLDIPGESSGRYPSTPPKQGGVGFLAYCGTDIEVTALQMAAVISTIANGGTLYALQYPRTAEERADFQPVVRRRLNDLTEYIPEIRDGLAAAVLYGTGRSAYDPDLAIYGKTGTCSENGARLGWFISYAGESHPRYVTVVLLRGGRMMYGPHAAEIAGRFYRDLMQKEHSAQASRADYTTILSRR